MAYQQAPKKKHEKETDNQYLMFVKMKTIQLYIYIIQIVSNRKKWIDYKIIYWGSSKTTFSAPYIIYKINAPAQPEKLSYLISYGQCIVTNNKKNHTTWQQTIPFSIQ